MSFGVLAAFSSNSKNMITPNQIGSALGLTNVILIVENGVATITADQPVTAAADCGANLRYIALAD